jgi:hypothetical protein
MWHKNCRMDAWVEQPVSEEGRCCTSDGLKSENHLTSTGQGIPDFRLGAGCVVGARQTMFPRWMTTAGKLVVFAAVVYSVYLLVGGPAEVCNHAQAHTHAHTHTRTHAHTTHILINLHTHIPMAASPFTSTDHPAASVHQYGHCSSLSFALNVGVLCGMASSAVFSYTHHDLSLIGCACLGVPCLHQNEIL